MGRIVYAMFGVMFVAVVVRLLSIPYDIPKLLQRESDFEEKKARRFEDIVSFTRDYKGYVVLGVDPSKCGYCSVFKDLVLGLTDEPIMYIDITDLSDEDLDRLVSRYGIESVPALLYSYYGDLEVIHIAKGKVREDLEELKRVFEYRW